jgi:hypothetical protein
VIATKLRQSLTALLVTAAAACCTPAHAAQLWYNGNRDNRDAITNQTSSSPTGVDGRVYENFVVGANTQFTITGVFSNDVKNPLFNFANPTTASWEIRSGVSAGNGGTLVAGGDGTDNVSSTGRTSTVFAPFSASEFHHEVDGLSVVLGAGTYWLSVAPDTNGALDSYWYVSTTSGAGAVGTPPGNDGNSFFSSASTGNSFTATSDIEGPGTWDYSLGVVGTAVAVPAPPAVVMGLGASLSLAAYGLAGLAYRRRAAAPARA